MELFFLEYSPLFYFGFLYILHADSSEEDCLLCKMLSMGTMFDSAFGIYFAHDKINLHNWQFL